MTLPYSVDELVAATHELLSVNGLPACYIRPIAFYGYGTLGVPPRENPVVRRDHELAVGHLPRRRRAREGDPRQGLDLAAGGAEHDPARGQGDRRLPELDARGAWRRTAPGYDEALLLTEDGYVGDGSGENIFVVKDGVIYTPDLSASILPGITRTRVVQIARDLGYEVREKPLIRTDLYVADELFMTGTAAEVTPIRVGRRRRDRRSRAHHEGDPGDVPERRSRARRSATPTGSSTSPSPRRSRALTPRASRSRSRSPCVGEREEELVARGAPLRAARARAR